MASGITARDIAELIAGQATENGRTKALRYKQSETGGYFPGRNPPLSTLIIFQ